MYLVDATMEDILTQLREQSPPPHTWSMQQLLDSLELSGPKREREEVASEYIPIIIRSLETYLGTHPELKRADIEKTWKEGSARYEILRGTRFAVGTPEYEKAGDVLRDLLYSKVKSISPEKWKIMLSGSDRIPLTIRMLIADNKWLTDVTQNKDVEKIAEIAIKNDYAELAQFLITTNRLTYQLAWKLAMTYASAATANMILTNGNLPLTLQQIGNIHLDLLYDHTNQGKELADARKLAVVNILIPINQQQQIVSPDALTLKLISTRNSLVLERLLQLPGTTIIDQLPVGGKTLSLLNLLVESDMRETFAAYVQRYNPTAAMLNERIETYARSVEIATILVNRGYTDPDIFITRAPAAVAAIFLQRIEYPMPLIETIAKTITYDDVSTAAAFAPLIDSLLHKSYRILDSMKRFASDDIGVALLTAWGAERVKCSARISQFVLKSIFRTKTRMPNTLRLIIEMTSLVAVLRRLTDEMGVVGGVGHDLRSLDNSCDESESDDSSEESDDVVKPITIDDDSDDDLEVISFDIPSELSYPMEKKYISVYKRMNNVLSAIRPLEITQTVLEEAYTLTHDPYVVGIILANVTNIFDQPSKYIVPMLTILSDNNYVLGGHSVAYDIELFYDKSTNRVMTPEYIQKRQQRVDKLIETNFESRIENCWGTNKEFYDYLESVLVDIANELDEGIKDLDEDGDYVSLDYIREMISPLIIACLETQRFINTEISSQMVSDYLTEKIIAYLDEFEVVIDLPLEDIGERMGDAEEVISSYGFDDNRKLPSIESVNNLPRKIDDDDKDFFSLPTNYANAVRFYKETIDQPEFSELLASYDEQKMMNPVTIRSRARDFVDAAIQLGFGSE